MQALPGGENPYRQVSSEVLHERANLRFMKDAVEIGGRLRDYSYADINNGVGIVAINEKNEVALVGQWRYPIQQYCWEIPAGMREPLEDTAETAKRELLEEAGVEAKRWDFLGSFFMESSSTNKMSFAYLARELTLKSQSLDEDERIEVLWLPFEEALARIEKGEIQDGLSVIGLLRAQDFLKNN